LCLNTTGSNNFAVGYYALASNTTGQHNIAIGCFSLLANTGGCRNIALGAGALCSNTLGNNNISIGCNSMCCNTLGTTNIAIGIDTLNQNANPGTNVIAIGTCALSAGGGTYNIAIGSGAGVYQTTTTCCNIFIGANSACSAWNAGNSVLIGNDVLGFYQSFGAYSPQYNVVLGHCALYTVNNNLGCNTAIGTRAMYCNTGSGMVAVGMCALANANGASAVGSVGIGNQALFNSIGSNNIALGYQSGCAITTGNYNVIIGGNTGSSITTSSCNIIISDGAGNARITVSNTGSTVITSNLASTNTVIGNALAVNGGVGISGSLYVTGVANFLSNVVFSGTTTNVVSTNTIYTDNVIELHVPNGGVGDTWTVNDGKDIGLRLHYYNGADKNAALVLSNSSKNLEWYSDAVETGLGTFTSAVYGNFKTGGISLVSGTSSTSVTSGDLTVTGGVGISKNLYVSGSIVLNGAPLSTQQALNTYEFTAGINSSTFGISGGYSIGQLEVYSNGVLMNSGDYTASDGSTIVFTAARVQGDIVQVRTFNTFTVANSVMATKAYATAISVAMAM
jgi:hypothetical protein